MLLKIVSSVVLVLCGFASSCLAMHIDEMKYNKLEPRASAAIVPLYWTGPVVDGGPEYEFTGTAEEILSQILQINPDYTPITRNSGSPSSFLSPSLTHTSKRSHDKEHDDNIDCNPSENWFYAAVSQLAREARYLQSLGDATCSAEARKCARVSCSYNTAIYFCNLRRHKWGIPCARLGQQVMDISNKCQTYNPENKNDVSKGRLRIPGDYELWAGEANPDC